MEVGGLDWPGIGNGQPVTWTTHSEHIVRWRLLFRECCSQTVLLLLLLVLVIGDVGSAKHAQEMPRSEDESRLRSPVVVIIILVSSSGSRRSN